MKNTLRMLAATAALSIPLSASAQILVSHDFGGLAEDGLNGVTTTTGGLTWNAGSGFLADGTMFDARSIDGGSAQGAWLAWTPVAGQQYELEATIFNTRTAWIGLGFVNQTASSDGHHGTHGVGAWAGFRNSDWAQLFNVGGVQESGVWESPDSPVEAIISLNTTGETWTASLTLNGTLRSTLNVLESEKAEIAGFGFSRSSWAAGTNEGNFIDDISLTAIPEPSTYALLFGAAVLGTALYRRRRQE